MTMTQAPSVNFVRRMMTATMKVTTAPTPLMAMPDFQPGSRLRRWWRAIPAWLSVKLVNTPIAYSGISRLTWAPVTVSSTEAVTARKTTPFENTSRWPRLVSWRGMKLSPAWNEASRGKSAKPVLAARIRISTVPIWSSAYST